MNTRSYGDPSYAIFVGERRKLHQDKYYRPTLKQQGYFPVRYLVSLLAFLGLMFSTMIISNVNLTMPYMVDRNITPIEDGCVSNNSYTDIEQDAHFKWDIDSQELVLGSFFWVYYWTALPGGRLSELLGPKRLIGISMTIASVLSLLIPVAAEFSYIILIDIRILMGLLLGVIYPSMITIAANWSPPHERSTITSIIWAGGLLGLAIGFGITGPIANSIGWDSVFYIEGSVSLAWCVAWALVFADKPEHCKYISKAERIYLATTIGEQKDEQPQSIPAKSVIRCIGVWAAFISTLANVWGLSILLVDIPYYLSSMLHLNQEKSAEVFIVGLVLAIIISLISGVASDYNIRHGVLSTTATRKIANTIGHLGTSICLIIIPYVECDASAVAALVVLALGFQGLTPIGHVANLIDLAPNYAGSLAGFTTMFGVLPGFLSPLTSALLTEDMQSFDQWSKVFYITFGIYLADVLFFVIFASGEVQPWNKVAPVQEDNNQWVMTRFGSEDDPDGIVGNKAKSKGIHRSKSYGGRQVMSSFKRSFEKPGIPETY
ncbi:unnamed protein product [Meganyctiphanes norvegica]|uniref:Major facilitator superfamily (MFS) profile domain-containing protein n=1 Tax=Meganyctiphanes norvegica TaxID=48144 RepID=A0AAV2S241_MEGNR